MRNPVQVKLWQALGGLLLFGLVGFTLGSHHPNFNFSKTNPDRPDFSSLNSLYDVLKKRFDGDIDPAKILEGARAGLVSAAGDPYTAYLSSEAAKALQDSLDGTLSGIGIEVGLKQNKLTVISPIDGSPASQAGIRAGDVIAAVNDEDSSTMTLDQAVSKIRGAKGTQVKLLIIRGSNQPQTITITRDIINVPSVKTEIKPGNIGYIEITQFGTDTDSKFDAAAKQMVAAGVTKIVLDLRNDPGGYLDKATSVASHFLPKDDVIVEERRGQTVIETMRSTGGDLEHVDMVVLVNGGSASASEILAGALQDHGRAKLIGEKTFGKGSVQAIEAQGAGAELKVTIAHWYTPKGRNITKEGIAPDTEVKLTPDDSNANRDPQLDAALRALQ